MTTNGSTVPDAPPTDKAADGPKSPETAPPPAEGDAVRAARVSTRGQVTAAVIAAVAVVVAGLIAALVPKVGSPPVTSTPATAAAAPSPAPGVRKVPDPAPAGGCVPAGLPDARQGQVAQLVGAGSPVSAGPAAYVLRTGGGPQVEIGGELRGVVPAGRTVVFFTWADPATKDTYGNRGDGNFYLSDSFRISGSCYYRDAFKVAYPGAEGITFRIYVALLPSDRMDELRKQNSDYGYSHAKLDQLGATEIAYVVVPTD